MNDTSAATRDKGSHTSQRIPPLLLPNADHAVRAASCSRNQVRPAEAVDVLLVNPPAPDGAIWIRSQHRVGRRSREGMVWPQVSLAQLAALLPDYHVKVVDAIAAHMSWQEFESLLRDRRPRYYVTQLTAPTLQNDMYGVFLAKSLGAVTITFGTHVTPLPCGTMEPYPALDYALRGEPELTLRELLDTLDWADQNRRPPQAQSPWSRLEPSFARRLQRLFTAADPEWRPAWLASGDQPALEAIKGLVWRKNALHRASVRQSDAPHDDACHPDAAIVMNAERPLIGNLDDLPLPRHELLPLAKYRAPMVRGAYAFVVTSRGCPAGCRFCIKHVSYGNAVRYRSPENVLAEIEQLIALGVRDIHMYADLFTVNREHVVGICEGILQRGWKLRWTCNSRVDFVDAELLQLMARAGCWMISWGIESGDDAMLKRMHKGITHPQVEQALHWAKQAHIMNWGYFIIGLPGETEESIRKTIAYAKRLPIDLVLFHIAAPHPGTPFFFQVVERGWFRPGTRWEEVDMDRSTVLDYPNLSAEQLEHWARVAFRQWAMRPGPAFTYLKMLLRSPSLWRPAIQIGLEALGWARG